MILNKNLVLERKSFEITAYNLTKDFKAKTLQGSIRLYPQIQWLYADQ